MKIRRVMIVMVLKGIKRRNKKLKTVFQFPAEDTDCTKKEEKLKKLTEIYY